MKPAARELCERPRDLRWVEHPGVVHFKSAVCPGSRPWHPARRRVGQAILSPKPRGPPGLLAGAGGRLQRPAGTVHAVRLWTEALPVGLRASTVIHQDLLAPDTGCPTAFYLPTAQQGQPLA